MAEKTLKEDIMELPEAPFVWFTNFEGKEGFQESVTLRAETEEGMWTTRRAVLDVLVKNGAKPVSRGFKSNGFDKTKIKPEDCKGHETYEAVVKKEGANKGRTFTACKNCNLFEWKKDAPSGVNF